jgi:hypothetical protein
MTESLMNNKYCIIYCGKDKDDSDWVTDDSVMSDDGKSDE